MKILLSGMTRMQAHKPLRRQYNTSINAFYNALQEAGHKVDWRQLQYDEKNLDSKYDLIILGLGTISEFSCNFLYETLLASRSRRVLYLVNDWKANSTIKLLRDGDIFRQFVAGNNTGKGLDRASKERVQKDRKLLERCREDMFSHANLVGPFFGWGDRSIILEDTPFKRIYEFDPSEFYIKNWGYVHIPSRRRESWVVAAIGDYSKWTGRLGAKWPIHSFNKRNFIPESQLVHDYYRNCWGTIFPKYKASGSGWWRARYCHAVICRNVVYADLSEIPTKILPWRPVEAIEQRSAKFLKELADDTTQRLEDMMLPWKDTVEQVNWIVKEAKRNG